MIDEVENIVTIINGLHDGVIILEKEENENLVWRVDCEYLAQMINPTFQFFWVKVNALKSITFNPWFISTELPSEIWKMPKEIFKNELEILSAEIEGEKIRVICNQGNPKFNYKGGELLLKCKSIELFDEKWNRLNDLDFRKMVTEYWRQFEKKK